MQLNEGALKWKKSETNEIITNELYSNFNKTNIYTHLSLLILRLSLELAAQLFCLFGNSCKSNSHTTNNKKKRSHTPSIRCH